jgi:hypothetical protein
MKIEILRLFIKERCKYHFDKIQYILSEKEKGIESDNLDILFREFNHRHQEDVTILRKLDSLFSRKKKIK